jgi:Domain of unknown function (DUF4262)
MADTAEQRRARSDDRVAADIQKYGYHVVSVFDPEQKLPTFCYSIGIQATCGSPEAIVLGVRPELGHFMINEYKDQVSKGARFERGQRYPGFLEGFQVYVEPAKAALLSEHTYGCTVSVASRPHCSLHPQ